MTKVYAVGKIVQVQNIFVKVFAAAIRKSKHAAMQSDELKRRVRDANNLVDLVQSAVGKLVRAGRNLKACCPFHNEKTPSFSVNPEGQFFHCFGCGKSGDVFTFVMLFERVEFPEALRILADRAGIQFEVDPKAVEQHKKETDWKSYLYKLNDAAARFYREQLSSNAGKTAREYIKKRGLSEEICEKFRIGYSPAGGSPLLQRLQGQKAPPKAIVAAGLATQREDGAIRDFFYDRLMFPISDLQGRVIAFGGRILGDGEPKYLNTRDTPLFSKTKTVYAIDHAREEIVEKREAILVEGYTDVMMCHQHGVTNVVACLGTAITIEHVRQLRRIADKLMMLTDSDAAGAKASERSLSVLFAEQMPATVARLPGKDKDPCDFLLAHGAEKFSEALKQTVELFDYKFEMVRAKHDIRQPLGLKSAVEELMELISTIPDTLLKNRYRYEIVQRLNIDERDLQYDVRRPAQVERSESDTAASDVGSVPLPSSELAGSERELLKFLFHEPAWLQEVVTQVDLSNLSGPVEKLIGMAMLGALGDGVLPPDLNTLQPGGSGSAVAREVLARLPDSSMDGGVLSEGARSLCVSLAESVTQGTKLDPKHRMEIVVRTVTLETLLLRYREAERFWTHARLQDDGTAEKAYVTVVALRKQIAAMKSRGNNDK